MSPGHEIGVPKEMIGCDDELWSETQWAAKRMAAPLTGRWHQELLLWGQEKNDSGVFVLDFGLEHLLWVIRNVDVKLKNKVMVKEEPFNNH